MWFKPENHNDSVAINARNMEDIRKQYNHLLGNKCKDSEIAQEAGRTSRSVACPLLSKTVGTIKGAVYAREAQRV